MTKVGTLLLSTFANSCCASDVWIQIRLNNSNLKVISSRGSVKESSDSQEDMVGA